MVEVGLGSGRVIEAPLTAAQEGLWLARRLDPANPSQNTGQILRLRGPLDAGMLQDVLRGVLAECDAFRVRILPDGETAKLTSAGVPPVEIPIVDLSAERDPERRARSRIQRDIERPRDPARDPMVTTAIYRLGPDAHWWYLCAQHLVIDGYGTTLLNVRVMDLLRAAISGSRPRTAPFASFRAVVREDAPLPGVGGAQGGSGVLANRTRRPSGGSRAQGGRAPRERVSSSSPEGVADGAVRRASGARARGARALAGRCRRGGRGLSATPCGRRRRRARRTADEPAGIGLRTRPVHGHERRAGACGRGRGRTPGRDRGARRRAHEDGARARPASQRGASPRARIRGRRSSPLWSPGQRPPLPAAPRGRRTGGDA